MSSGQAYVVKVVETDAELRTNKWVGRRVKLSSDAVRLEAVDSCSYVVNIVAPSCHDWVSLDGFARDAVGCHRSLETYMLVSLCIILSAAIYN